MPFPECVPELTDGVTRLRAHRQGDAQRIVEQSTDPDSLRWTTVPAPYGLIQAQDFLTEIEAGWNAAGGVRYWAICAAADPHELYQGTIDLRPRSGSGLAAVGYGLHPEGRGRHLMSGALRLVGRYWFEQCGGARLTWTAIGGNLGSWAVARSAGFTFDVVVPSCTALRTGEIVDEWQGSRDAGTPAHARTPWHRAPAAASVRAAHAGIRFRDWRPEDGQFLEEHDHRAHWLPSRGIPTPDSFSAWLSRRRLYEARGMACGWCLADAETDRPLGDVCLFANDSPFAAGGVAELGYWVSPSARGRAVARAGVEGAMAFAFAADGLGLRRVIAETAADNVASNRVLEVAGFTIWGREAEAVAPDGSFGPAHHWERIG